MIDVDGVISLFGFDQTEPPEGRFVIVDGIPHLISARAGERLARLHEVFECVWCTGWEDRAEEHLPRLLGLPRGLGAPDLRARARRGPALEARGDRGLHRPRAPVAWIDDAHDASCERWAAERPGATLLVATDPAVGITDEHVETLLSWARAASG